MLNEKFRMRFAELEAQAAGFKSVPSASGRSRSYPHAEFKGWGASAETLIFAVFGKNAPHYTAFVSALTNCVGLTYEVDTLRAVFRSAKDAFDNGYVFNVELIVSGELFGDFVAMAKHALSEGYKDVAAVLASAALEDTLKRYAVINGLTVGGNSMQDTVNALKSKGLVTGAQKTLLESMPKIRDYAMHASWDKINAPDVSSVIGYVEQFLLTHFSGP